MSDNLTIAVSKGRILESLADLFQKGGWSWPRETRQLWFPPQGLRPGLVVARGQDIPTLVERGAAAFGIVGRDILAERDGVDVLDVLDLGLAQCRLVVASLDGLPPVGPVRVATKYPNVTHRYFSAAGHTVEVVPLTGSLELAPHLGLAPYIVDVVQTGQTLRQHMLREVDTVLTSSARLIVNPAVWRTTDQARTLYEVLRSGVGVGAEFDRERRGSG